MLKVNLCKTAAVVILVLSINGAAAVAAHNHCDGLPHDDCNLCIQQGKNDAADTPCLITQAYRKCFEENPSSVMQFVYLAPIFNNSPHAPPSL
jgi:hypothetical protein